MRQSVTRSQARKSSNEHKLLTLIWLQSAGKSQVPDHFSSLVPGDTCSGGALVRASHGSSTMLHVPVGLVGNVTKY